MTSRLKSKIGYCAVCDSDDVELTLPDRPEGNEYEMCQVCVGNRLNYMINGGSVELLDVIKTKAGS